MLKEGDLAPAFSLKDSHGKTHRLSSYRGKRVVLFFYPKDHTPGCTLQASHFRDRLNLFRKRNAVVLGVSPDDVDSHRRFAEKLNLNFPLLSDSGARVATKYGVWGQKTLLGRSFMSVHRSTFIIDERGRIAKVFNDVRVDGHSREVLSALARA
ncbi:MAG: thioredoxin-dependent thiol peroxidase [Nitrospinota bacterium]